MRQRGLEIVLFAFLYTKVCNKSCRWQVRLVYRRKRSMKELVILIRPEKLEDVKKILDDINCGGMTLSTVMGCGTQKGISADAEETVNEIRGFKTTINLLPKVRVEVVIEDKDVEPVIEKVRETCVTGHVGDGKIFIRNIEDAIRIRTGERGTKAL